MRNNQRPATPVARQKTLKTDISCVGTGLHSGTKTRMTLRPADVGSGIVFRRTDIAGSGDIGGSGAVQRIKASVSGSGDVRLADLRADEPGVAATERLVALGAAIQNLLLAAQARGWGSALTSGRAMGSAALRQAFDLQEGEHAVCCITLGTVGRAKPPRL